MERGWKIRATILGFALKPPKDFEALSGCELPKEAQELVNTLGLGKDFELSFCPPLSDFFETEKMLREQLLYQRGLHEIGSKDFDLLGEFRVNPKRVKNMLRSLVAKKNRLGEVLEIESEYDYGTLNGTLAALRWVMGQESDLLNS